VDLNRKLWNQQQQILRKKLSIPTEHQEAIQLFLDQHAMVHTADMSESGLWSFEDEIWLGMDDKDIRCLPDGFEHSIAWMIWHTTRIEDITMNMLLADNPELFNKDGWCDRLGISFRDTGNAMTTAEITTLSAQINIKALREYRIATGCRTRQIVTLLKPSDLAQRVHPARLQRVFDEGAVVSAARGLLDYWGGLTASGLLLMPPTRHPFIHLNEALRLKTKLRKTVKSLA
jgi:hypothetical protein